METGTVLQLRDISKTYPGVQALNKVNIDVREGEVHAIVGENGAGKSTLLNVLSGTIQDYNGEIIYKGRPIRIRSPFVARKLGINMVHQELFLVPELSAARNIFLGDEPRRKGTAFVNWNEIHRRSEELLQRLESNFSAREPVKNLSTAQMQMVEIAKALLHRSHVLAFDEPTSSLSTHEIRKLFETITKLKAAGTSIIYISHRLEEIFEIADRITVLRDGKCIGTYPVGETNKPLLVQLMIGRDVSEYTHHVKSYARDEKVLEVKNLGLGKKFHEVSFFLKRGEILGLAGLVGAGRTDVALSIFGACRYDRGDILLEGRKASIRSPVDALARGIALIPEDRKLQGLVGILTNTSNVCISSLDRLSRLLLIRQNRLRKNASTYMAELRVNPPNPSMRTKNLSGGNQQKIVLAKWLSSKAKILIFDEPTRGIDVGAKAEIHRLMDELLREGYSILMISSELPEIIGMSDRILVMHEGRIVKELTEKTDFTEEKILHYAMGVS